MYRQVEEVAPELIAGNLAGFVSLIWKEADQEGVGGLKVKLRERR
jgi:hypothetical protein